MLFNEFNRKHEIKTKATSNTKIYQVLSFTGLNNFDIYLTDGPFLNDIGIVSLHPSKGTHLVLYTNESYFDSYGCAPPQKLSKFIIKTKWSLYINTPNTKIKV